MGRRKPFTYATLISGRSLIGATIALLLSASPAAAQKKVERRIPLGMEGALRIANMVGSVVVHGWNKDTVMVRGMPLGWQVQRRLLPWPPAV